MSTGGLFCHYGIHNPEFVLIGATMAGIAAPVLIISWGKYYASIGLFRAAVCVALSMILRPAIRLLLLPANESTVGLAVAVLPFLSLALLVAALHEQLAHRTSNRKKAVGPFAPIPLPRLIIGVSVYSFVFGAFYGITRFAPNYGPINPAFIVVADLFAGLLLLACALGLGDKLTLPRLHYPVPILMISGLALLPLLGSSKTSPPMVLISIAWMYVLLVVWVFLSERTSSDIKSSVRFFAWGQVAVNAPMLIGTLVGTAFEQRFGLAPTVLTLAALSLVYLLATSVYLLFSGGGSLKNPVRVGITDSILPTNATQTLASSTTGVPPFSGDVGVLTEAYALSNREADVLLLLARGLNARGIAEHLSISRNTVRTHIQHIYEKLNISSQQELLKIIDRLHVSGHQAEV
ncbi:MAG: helix-turn-helix transcriptional regulator [Coriobacteriia bacterium]|nr:helix-turn-helix transcriptional regulator [Coriobacteriia bacterium]